MKKAIIYRVGKIGGGNHSESLIDFWRSMDALKPAAHPTGRSEAIYTSPNLHGLHRWVRITTLRNQDLEVHEIVVDAETVYAYEVDIYEDVPSWPFSSPREIKEQFKPRTEKFWATGMTLAKWLEVADTKDGSNTEILLAPEAVISSKKLSYVQILAHMQKVGMDRTEELALERYKSLIE